jgi:hypothetical protein
MPPISVDTLPDRQGQKVCHLRLIYLKTLKRRFAILSLNRLISLQHMHIPPIPVMNFSSYKTMAYSRFLANLVRGLTPDVPVSDLAGCARVMILIAPSASRRFSASFT